nr:hypothetical protein Iba_chr13fCG8420 [Ipomoea batatas]GME17695.1 hypothetical protein Iba_scaffold19277CG0010 [Ipomoea batatas]
MTLMIVGGRARKNLPHPGPEACEVGTGPRGMAFADHIATLEGWPFEEGRRQSALLREGRVEETSSKARPGATCPGLPSLRLQRRQWAVPTRLFPRGKVKRALLRRSG